jgi:hypothetical protein
MGRDTHGFVDDDEIVVVEQDIQAFHNFLHNFQGVPAFRDGDVQDVAGRELRRFAHGLALVQDVAFGQQGRSDGP